MAPAQVAGARSTEAARRRGGWDRDQIINAIQEWVATYGEPPRAADWNPSAARWSGQLWRVERYRDGRADGSAWPALNTAKRVFGGSLTAAIVAAGYEPAKPGPPRRTDVELEQADRVQLPPDGRALLAAAQAQSTEASKRIATLERQLEREKARPPREKVVRERVPDRAAIARAERRARQATAKAAEVTGELSEARMDAAEARATAQRLASRLERAEATIATLRSERDGTQTSSSQLHAAEIEALRVEGPAGPAVLAGALRDLATARASGSPTRLARALHKVAQAAVSWQQRL